MKRTQWKRKSTWKGFKKPVSGFKIAKFGSKTLLKRTKLRVKGYSTTNEIKDEIQALCREIVIIRDGGCILRHYAETGKCGGYRKDGKLILQFDHLNSRVHSISYGDTRLGVCLCKRHHIFWKKKEPMLFSNIVNKHIGKDRAKLLERVQQDRLSHKMDWMLVKVALEKELKDLKKKC